MRLAVALAATLALLVAATPAHARSCPNADLAPAAGTLPEVRDATLCLLNRERAERGAPRLRAHGDLQRSAGRFSRAMVEGGFFAHVAPDGSTMTDRIRATGYLAGIRGYRVGENLAWGTGERATPRETVAAWMRSPGHRANLLDVRYRAVGVGVAPGVPVRRAGAPGATYTTHFGSRTSGA
jgi:uncharacterized protein YkwD